MPESTSSAPDQTETIASIVRFAQALSDPVRVRILALLLQGRNACCNPSSEENQGDSVCVCEIVDYLGLLQSKVSYHLAKLKAAGLIREERRGKWNYYSVDHQQAAQLVHICACFLRRRI